MDVAKLVLILLLIFFMVAACSQPAPGRYQLVTGSFGLIYIDTQTGRMWTFDEEKGWAPLHSPMDNEKR